MTVATTSSVAASSSEEKPVLSPVLLQLTQSLREWETPVTSKTGIEEPDRLHLENLIRPFTVDVPAPPGLPKVTRLCWTIDKAKSILASGDGIKLSTSMQVPLGEGKAPAKFKFMLKPQMHSEGRGGASFKRSKGKGFIELKCEEGQDVIGNTRLYFWVGDQLPRGPVEHNFSSDVVGRLPRDIHLWDLKTSVGQKPSNPEAWDPNMSVQEGCLVLGVEIWVASADEVAPCD